MLQHSIFTRLTLFFTFIIVAIVVGFYFLRVEVERQNHAEMEKESDRMITLLRRSIVFPEKERKQFFEARGYTYAPINEASTQELTAVFDTIPERFTSEIKNSIKEGRIQIMASKGILYVLINRPKTPFMVGAEYSTIYMTWLWGGFLVLLFLIITLFFSIIHSLLPLKQLTHAIWKYGENGTYIPTKSSGKDEIAYVANAFDETARKNRALMEARHLFMRNVMHELKTPITVGKLALPFLETSSETQMLERAFVRMELLIKDMAHTEQVTSQSIIPEHKPCNLAQLSDEAAALMLSDAGVIVREFETDDTILADCRMMSTVFKNLIDNAFKYSDDKRVTIRREKEALLFINRGKAWPPTRQFETMLEPFVHNNTDQPSKSFGLGLYIVKSILDTHAIGFSHHYKEGKHCFVLEGIPPATKSA